MNPIKKIITLSILPLLVIALGVYMFMFFDPFYSRAIDPEFPYLVNGLNMAQLKFNYIGHYDHPGTPLQIFNGIVIRIVHLFSGEGNIVQDVFARSEHYLNSISAFMLVIQAALVFAVGLMGVKRNLPYWQIAILQASCFFNDVLVWLFCRANPDRFFMIVGLLFILVYLKHGYENRSPRKFALWSASVMALGLATKFNFFPLLFLPLLLIETNKNRLIYAGSGIVSFFIFISPIINKFDDFLRFITGIYKHDGLYGGGEEKVMNLQKMMASTGEIFSLNPGMYLLILALVISTVIAFRKRKEGMLRFVFLFAGLLVIIALQMVMVSKHFKNYYLAPTFIMYGFIFFSLSHFYSKIIADKSRLILVSSLLPLAFILFTASKVNKEHTEITHSIIQRTQLRKFVDKSIDKSDFWFIEPTWEAGPYAENALVYGLSYCGHRVDYMPQLMAINPNRVTFEDNDEVVKLWRGITVQLDSVVATGKNIYILSTPGRRAPLLLELVKNAAARNNIELSVETVFSDSEKKNEILKVKALNSSLNWQPNSALVSERDMKVAEYISSIKNSPEWLEKVRQKAIDKHIPLDSMILLDAIYMVDEVN
ncbi:MAG TPA: hypothetical protein VFG54_04095 [Prolixibacteraceae bacterium]|nr:hypothetical protein [Prolixibacteraceae bacterium]